MTGIILIFELTGSLSQMLSLSVVTVIAYITAMNVKSEPIYEVFLQDFWKGKTADAGRRRRKGTGYYAVAEGSPVAGCMVKRSAGQKRACLYRSGGVRKN